MLSFLNPEWAQWLAVLYVMIAQAFSGIAKDLTKMSTKSAIRLVVPQDAQSALFKWVAILTGSKNALKGVGFFIGSALLGLCGFVNSLWIMAGCLFLLLFTGLFLPKGMGKIKAKVKFKQLFSKSPEINLLSAARFFLFGSRDVWFVVGLPVFLRSVLGWSFYQVGGFLACWVIGYGLIQSLAPTLIKRFGSGQPPRSQTVRFWTTSLIAVPALIAIALQLNLNVGFYYMANSGGRLAGTVLSGLVYQFAGLVGCLWVSTALVLAAAVITHKLPDPQISKAIAWKSDGE